MKGETRDVVECFPLHFKTGSSFGREFKYRQHVFLSIRFYRHNIQKKLLAEKNLTFAKAFETAQPGELESKEEFHEVRIPPRKIR